MTDRDDTRLRISREAARLFVAHGLAETSGDAIAEAAGVSTRTIWRHFRNKENCIEPVLIGSIQRLAGILKEWPLEMALEMHLRAALPLEGETSQLIADGKLAVQLLALCEKEPDIRTVWLDAYYFLEIELHDVIARRANRSTLDFDVRMCAATIVAAIRIVDQAVTVAALNEDRNYASGDLADLLSGAIRNAATLPICDPVASGIYRRSASRRSSGA